MELENNKYFTCDICGKILKNKTVHNAFGKTLCGKHYMQKQKHGIFLDNEPRSIADRNDIITYDNHCEIILRNLKQEIVGKALIDIKFKNECIKKKWRLWNNNIVTGNNIGDNTIIQLHRFVYSLEHGNIKDDYIIDHINSNRMDNRIFNLRMTTQDKNCFNKAYMSNNKSGVIGVRYDKYRDRFVVEIGSNCKGSKIGRFRFGRNDINFEQAVYLRYLCEINIFKEFRSTQNNKEFLNCISQLSAKSISNMNDYFIPKYKDKFKIEPTIPNKDEILKTIKGEIINDMQL